jgi:hypothetical protein
MRREQLEAAVRAQLFRPFRITLTNGQTHEERHSELAFMLRGTLIIGDPDASDQGADRFAIIDISHIAQLDRESAPVPPTNGDANEE